MTDTIVTNPDLDAASKFISTLAGTGLLYVRAIPDTGGDGINYSGPAPQVLDWLARKNLDGYGAFVTVNGGGTKKVDITEVRAFFADFDEPGTASELLTRCPFEPTILVETSPGKFHAYWVVSGIDVDAYAKALPVFAEVMGGDQNVKDIARVMRVPGFYHLKDPASPFQSRLVKNDGPTYDWSVFATWLRTMVKPKPTPAPVDPVKVNGDGHPYINAALDGAIESVLSAPEGTRNATLNTEAFGLFGLVKGGLLAEDKAYSILEQCASQAGLRPDEIRKTLQSAMDAATPRSIPEGHGPGPRPSPAADNVTPDEKLIFLPLKPLTDTLPSVPQFDYSMLPEAFVDYVVNTSERMDNSAPDFVAVACMVAAASLVGGRCLMQPKANDAGWKLPVTLWGLGVGNPASKKSPELKAGKDLLAPFEIELDEQQSNAMRDYDIDEKLHKKIVLSIEKDFDKFLSPTGKSAQRPSASDVAARKEDMAAELRQLTEPAKPRLKRLVVNDTTMEKLIVHMGCNQMGMLLFRDEMSGFFAKLLKEEYQHERAFYLECREGYGNRYQQSRMSRDEEKLDHTILSILGGIQPAKLQKLITQRNEGDGDDGLLERFQLMVYPDISVSATDIAPSTAAKAKAQSFMDRLFRMNELDESPVSRFDAVAQADYDDWRHRHIQELRDSPAHWQAIMGKYESLVASLALLCHLGQGGSPGSDVGSDALIMALKWSEYLKAHARRIYHFTHDPNMGAKALLENIHKLPNPFTASDFRDRGWSCLKTKEQRSDALATLVARGYLAAETHDTGGRPVVRYYANQEAIKE